MTRHHWTVHYPGLSGNNWELFDLRNDPSEMNNLYRSPEQKAALYGLRRLLASLIRHCGDTTATLE